MATPHSEFIAAPYGRVWIWMKRPRGEILARIWPYRTFDQTGKFVHEIEIEQSEEEMATLMDDGSLLIHAALDGPFEEVSASRRVEAVAKPRAPLELQPVRAKQLSPQERQVVIKQKIKELQNWDKTLSFANACRKMQLNLDPTRKVLPQRHALTSSHPPSPPASPPAP